MGGVMVVDFQKSFSSKYGSCCAVLCCAVLCCAVLCCAVLCCAVLCCAPRNGAEIVQKCRGEKGGDGVVWSCHNILLPLWLWKADEKKDQERN